MKKVLILEAVHPEAVRLLKERYIVEVSLETPRERLIERIKSADALIVRSVTQVDRRLLACAPKLRVIGRAGTGTDNIDLACAQQRGIPVLTVPEGNVVSVAEFTVLQALSFCRRFPELLNAAAANDFRREKYQGVELASRTVGIVGLGRIGQMVAQRLAAFGCRLIGFDINPLLAERFRELGVAWMPSLEDALLSSDILTLHVPKTKQTTGMIARRQLQMMKPGAFLINTSRGGIIVEQDLLESIDNGHTGGAAIDVLEQEPPFNLAPEKVRYANPLLRHERIVVTPHCAASTEDAQRKIALKLVAGIDEVLGKTESARSATEVPV
jgi:D-3-phosphoglycerate dehydrogenase